MRASAAAAILMAPGLLLPLASHAWASSACQSAFERWAVLSNAQVRPTRGDAGRGACIPSESTRRSLLDALARMQDLCGDSSDPSLQQTRTLLYINHSFISSLGVCASDGAEAPRGWTAEAAPVMGRPKEAAPVVARPKIAAPLPGPSAPVAPPPRAAAPPPPAPITGGPRPSAIAPAPPKPVAAAPLVPPPRAQAAAPPPKPPCLEVSSAQGDGYAFVNRRCSGHTVLAVIETRAASGQTACKGYAISASLTMRAPSTPRINYECVLSKSTCNKDRLGEMFPECDW